MTTTYTTLKGILDTVKSDAIIPNVEKKDNTFTYTYTSAKMNLRAIIVVDTKENTEKIILTDYNHNFIAEAAK